MADTQDPFGLPNRLFEQIPSVQKENREFFAILRAAYLACTRAAHDVIVVPNRFSLGEAPIDGVTVDTSEIYFWATNVVSDDGDEIMKPRLEHCAGMIREGYAIHKELLGHFTQINQGLKEREKRTVIRHARKLTEKIREYGQHVEDATKDTAVPQFLFHLAYGGGTYDYLKETRRAREIGRQENVLEVDFEQEETTGANITIVPQFNKSRSKEGLEKEIEKIKRATTAIEKKTSASMLVQIYPEGEVGCYTEQLNVVRRTLEAHYGFDIEQ